MYLRRIGTKNGLGPDNKLGFTTATPSGRCCKNRRTRLSLLSLILRQIISVFSFDALTHKFKQVRLTTLSALPSIDPVGPLHTPVAIYMFSCIFLHPKHSKGMHVWRVFVNLSVFLPTPSLILLMSFFTVPTSRPGIMGGLNRVVLN